MGPGGDLPSGGNTTPAKPSGAVPTAVCTVPDEDRCLQPGFLDSACGRKHKETCKPLVEHAVKSDPGFKAAPETSMLHVGKSDMPKHLIERRDVLKRLAGTESAT